MAYAPRSLPIALIIDPDAAHQQLLAHCLFPGFHVIGAARLTEATVQLQQHRPSVVLLDPDLPDGDGLRWVTQVRANPATRDLVIACITHRSSVRDKIAGFQAGADDYVVNPIDPDTFLYRITLLARIGRRWY